jgi:tetratricopeptide (TPR) repeat protein
MLIHSRLVCTVKVSMVCSLVLSLLNSCSDNKQARKTSEPVSASGSEAKEDSGATSLSGDRRFLTTSVTNNVFTSKHIDKSRAADFASQHGSGKSKDINTLAATISANRMAGRGVNDVMAEARQIADLEMSKNVDRDIPELVQLELGLTGVQTGRLAFAEFWLDKLLKSKNATIRASAINAKGVVAIRMERIPEAIVLFKEALAVNSEYKPALMNIGFLALQGGDVATAKRALGGMQDDWYVMSGLVSVLRLEGDVDKADAACEKVLSQHPKHKPTLINCGINSWQGKRDYKKARDYLNRALSVSGGAAVWDEKAGKLLGAIDSEEARAAQLKSLKESEERKAKEQAEKAKVPAGQPQPAKPADGSSPSAGGSSQEPPKKP